MDNLFKELRRRNMFRVAGAYAVVGWFLMQLAVVLEGSLNLPSWFDTFVTVIVLIGFPIALLLAWAFELTPDGIKPTAHVPDDQSIAHQTGRKLEYGILAGLLLVGGLMIADQFTHNEGPAPRPEQAATTPDPVSSDATLAEPASTSIKHVKKASEIKNKSVAVLPFENRSAIENDAFFAAGIHDDLLTQLSKMSALEVISRTSVMGYAGTEKKVPEIATELGVAVIVEGAVQRGGNRVLITVQVIDGTTDNHLWAERYDRELTTENIFEIQSEITHVIAQTLEAVLSQQDEATLGAPLTKSMSAYDHYIRAKILTQPGSHSVSEVDQAIDAYDAAIAEDPGFGAAWAGKAYAQLTKYWFLGRDKTYVEAARKSLDQAEALSPDSPETLIPLAFYYYWGLRDFETASEIFDRAIMAAPNHVDAIAGKAFIKRSQGKLDQAAEGLKTAHRLDPLSYYLLPELALTLSLTGEFDDANEMMRRAKAISPGSEHAAIFEAAVWQFQGKPEDAWDAVRSVDGGDVFRFYEQLANYALATRDPEKISMMTRKWPKEERSPESAPELYNIFKLKSLLLAGEDDAVKQERKAMRARIKKRNDAYPETWFTNQSYSPAVIPGLLGDLKTVKKVANDYETQPEQEALRSLTYLGDLADAFARAGDPDSALDYMERMRLLTGPHMFLYFEDEAGFDGLRDHPRYLKMKADYDAWALSRSK